MVTPPCAPTGRRQQRPKHFVDSVAGAQTSSAAVRLRRARCRRSCLGVGAGASCGVVRLLLEVDLLQLLAHAEPQQHHGDRQRQEHHEPEPARLDVGRVGGLVDERHEQRRAGCSCAQSLNLLAHPGEQVVLGQLGSRPTLRTSSKSSVGQTSCWSSSGIANQAPSGSIWVACASSAWSRTPKYSAHGTRVVIRASCSGSGFHSSSRSAYGDSSPAASIASCSAASAAGGTSGGSRASAAATARPRRGTASGSPAASNAATLILWHMMWSGCG